MCVCVCQKKCSHVHEVYLQLCYYLHELFSIFSIYCSWLILLDLCHVMFMIKKLTIGIIQ